MSQVDLRSLRLRSGEELTEEREIEIAPLELGEAALRRRAGDDAGRVDATRTTDGWLFRLRCSVRLHGPCMRCLDDAALDQPIDVLEYHADSPQGDDELTSAYVVADRLELDSWARDSVLLALPSPDPVPA
jgi:uncharacterized protein